MVDSESFKRRDVDAGQASLAVAPCLTNTFLFGEWLLSSGKAPRRVIARYGEERQRSMTATDAVKEEQYS
ncbi:hypothetical protein EMIT0P43_90050 [Pseudomonas jessenii]